MSQRDPLKFLPLKESKMNKFGRFCKFVLYPWYIAFVLYLMGSAFWITSEYLSWWASRNIWRY